MMQVRIKLVCGEKGCMGRMEKRCVGKPGFGQEPKSIYVCPLCGRKIEPLYDVLFSKEMR
ncbi:hypothetical protein COY03_04070 [bacterium CG_4_10_14_0_2_um_filter_48_144]|nr:MAG: hypothetical protein COY03_04070 [bacterium CG_4_10_14_0_2_um_filter_48_144]